MRYLVGALFAATLALTASPVEAASRVALVIGNSAYSHAVHLKNPSNDAGAMAKALEALGFEVVLGRDLEKAGMESAIRAFTKRLAGAKVALFYYAGHGLQVAGKNYLAPVDARLQSVEDLDFETVALRLVLRQMERGQRTNLIFLDACRDNPLAKNLARGMGTRSGGVGRGLARVESGIGTLISFATQPGNVALDGKGRNSPFTTALVKHIRAPGKSLSEIMIEVRKDVLKSSGGKQVPWERSSLTGQFYFSAAAASAAAPPPAKVARAARGDNSLELAYWDSIRNSTSVRAFKSYLEQYPAGTFAPLARIKIEELEARKTVATPPPAKKAAPRARRKPARAARPVEACDRLAAVPFDPNAKGGGLWTFRALLKPGTRAAGEIGKRAVAACRRAVKERPGVERLRYQLAIALWLAKGDAAGTELHEALKWAAEKRYPAAMLSFADAYKDQPVGGGRMLKGRVWLQRATDAYRAKAKSGNAAAMAGLAFIFSGQYTKLGVGRQKAKMHYWLRQGVKAEHGLSTFLLMSLFSGEFGGLANKRAEYNWLLGQAKAGNPRAMFAAGTLMLSGEHGIPKDAAKGLDWLRKAYDRDAVEAGLVLALVEDQAGRDYGRAARYVLEAFKAETPFVFLLTDDKGFTLSERTWTEVQRRLAAAGVYEGRADGIFGKGTKRALFAYASSP